MSPIIAAKDVKAKYGKYIHLELVDVVLFLPYRMANVLQGKELHFLRNNYQLVLRDVVKVGAHETSHFEIIVE